MDCCDAGWKSNWLGPPHHCQKCNALWVIERTCLGTERHLFVCKDTHTHTDLFVIVLELNNSMILSAPTTTNDLIMLIWARNSEVCVCACVCLCVCQQDWQEPTGFSSETLIWNFTSLSQKALGYTHMQKLLTHTHRCKQYIAMQLCVCVCLHACIRARPMTG